MSKKTQNKQQRQQKRRQRKTQKKQQKCQQKQQKQRKTQKRQQKRQQQRRSRKKQLKKKQRGGTNAVSSADDIEKINEILGWLNDLLFKENKIKITKLIRDLASAIIDSNRSKNNVNLYIKAIKEKKVQGPNVDNFLLLIKNPDLAVEYFNSDYHVIDVIDGINEYLKEEQKISDNKRDEIRNSFIEHKAATETSPGVRKSTEQTQTPLSQPTLTRPRPNVRYPRPPENGWAVSKRSSYPFTNGGKPVTDAKTAHAMDVAHRTRTRGRDHSTSHVEASEAPTTKTALQSPEQPQTPRTFNVEETKTNDDKICYSIIEVPQSS